MSESDWKKRVGIQINYSPGHSSDDEDNLRAENGKRNEMGLTRFEHMRGPSEHLLNDGEDVSPADLLGTTPPRLRIRNKEKKRTNLENDVALRRLMRVARRNTVDNFFSANIVTAADIIDGPGRKRSSLKLLRGKERDMKLDIGEARGYRTESLPSPGIDLVASRKPAIPTLVESCSRFMSLSSKLKCASFKMKGEAEDCLQQAACHMELEPEVDERVPANRIHFHKTFSMLIKMGSIDKGCRRTISVEEQVWQNELKDLIWLEIRAKLAGRTLQQQDCILCSQRNIVPTIIQNIINYRFSETKCFGKFGATSPAISSRSSDGYGSDDSLSHVEHEDYSLNTNPKLETINENVPGSEAKCHQIPDHQSFGCLCFNCDPCSNTVGKALKEVRTLLDSFCNAESLYPSSKAMAIHHPLIATQLFNNRLKALCLWYNMAYHVRLKILIIRKMINMLKKKTLEKQRRYETNDSENRDPTQTDASKPPLVRFSGTSCDSNNSDLDPKSSHDETDHTVMLSRKISTETMDSSKPSSGTTSDSNKSCPKSNDKYGSNDSNGTSSTVSSTESGFGSDDHKIRNQAEPAEADDMSHKYVHGHDVFNIGSLSELTQLKLLGNCKVSPYRQYIEEVLKTKGLRKALNFLEKMHLNVLQRAHMTFQKYDSSKQYTDESGEVMEEAETESKEKEEEPAEPTEGSKNCMELRRYGCWSEETMQMRLPSYRSSFLFLCTICVEVCHEYLDMRLETKPEKPSILSIKQLIQEVKEGLDIASIERSRFVRNVDTAICGYTNSTDAKNYLGRIIQKFDDTVERVFKHYLGYLTAWSDMEHIPRNVLEAEWTFTANLAKRIKCAAMLTPITFANIVTLQLEKVTLRFNEKFATLDSSLADYDSDSNSASDDEDRLDHIRRLALAQCREAQQIFSTERELIIQTAHFSRLLSGRLRKNSLFAPSRTKLYHAMMEARDSIFKWINIVTNRSNSKYLRDLGESYDNSLTIRTKEVLLHGYKFGFEFHRELYKFAYHHQPKVMPNPMVPVRERPSSVIEYRPARRERSRRPGTVMGGEVVNVALVNNRSFHRELHKFVNEPPCARTAPTGVARPLRPAPPPPCAPVPPPRRPKFMRSDSVGGDAYNKAVFEDIAPTFNTMTSIEYSVPDIAFEGEELLFKQCSIDEQECLSNARKLPSKLEEVVTRKRHSVTGNEDSEWAVAVSRAIIEFAKHWMSFVMDRCDRGRGLRPRWANHGLEFLMLACDPCNTRHLTEAEFESLKGVMDDCISHVIGSTVPATSPAALLPSPPAHGTPPPQRRARHARHYHHPLVQLQNKHKDVPTPPTPPSEPQLVVIFDNQEETSHSERVAAAIAALDETRDLERQERGVVGRPLNRGATPASAEPLPRQVTFRWQRGIKIGAGRFGKVYTVVNTESGQLLAMKEVSLGPGDRRAVQKAANELRVLEGVLHPNLVRYYGCEIHREEMLIFMELCMEGSLEALVAECAGLPEQQVRRYAQQLLSAIAELHDRKIAHRDIKSGNIFLTNEGHCLKLGDFGCAVKIRANTTVAGELQGYVGTQAYMAPEVFMKSSGHGRAADIWSYGCVVTEMASGKRPFSDYDSNYQIMFMVGMGGRPETPASLSAEGQEFCLQCLTHDPEERPRATELASHHFLKVKQECNCEVSYLIT